MRIAVEPLYDLNISAVHVERTGEPPWTFVPFDDEAVRTIEALGDGHLLALGDRKRIAIWRIADRVRTVLTHTKGSHADFVRRALAPRRSSLFLDEWPRDDHQSIIRELALDGSRECEHRIPTISARAMASVNGGGKIVLLGSAKTSSGWHSSFLLVDPCSGESDVFPLPPGFRIEGSEEEMTLPRHFSPNGELVIRPHLGSVAHAPAGRFRRLLATRRVTWGDHPDLAGHPDEDCYGVALDVYETGTGQLRTRLLVGFTSASEYDLRAQRSGWAPDGQIHNLHYAVRGAANDGLALDMPELVRKWVKLRKPFFRSILERLAEHHPYDAWDGSLQIAFTNERDRGPSKAQQELTSFPFKFLMDVKICWREDNQAITVTFPNGSTREVSLDGELGALRCPEPTPERLIVPAKDVRAIRREYKARGVNEIKLGGLELADCTAALGEMANRMESGLRELLHNDILDWRFKHGRKSLDEANFFRHLRSFTIQEQEALVAPLRRLMKSYGEQAALLHPSHKEQFISGVGSDDDETWTTALSDSALYLAEVDPDAGDYLRGWLIAVDQEHDQVAAGRVLPAVASRSRFKTEPSLRFGVFYMLQQWQTPSTSFDQLGLVAAARDWCSPERFAAMVRKEACASAVLRSQLTDALSIKPIIPLLDSTTFWDRRVKALLQSVVVPEKGGNA